MVLPRFEFEGFGLVWFAGEAYKIGGEPISRVAGLSKASSTHARNTEPS